MGALMELGGIGHDAKARGLYGGCACGGKTRGGRSEGFVMEEGVECEWARFGAFF